MSVVKVRYDEATEEFWAAHADCWWGDEDCERYDKTDPDEAIEVVLESRCGDGLPLEGEVVVEAARRLVLSEKEIAAAAEQALESVVERWDEEYGDPEGSRESYRPEMQTAAETFVRAVLAEYEVFACEVVARVTVDVAAWVREHRPDWLEGGA